MEKELNLKEDWSSVDSKEQTNTRKCGKGSRGSGLQTEYCYLAHLPSCRWASVHRAGGDSGSFLLRCDLVGGVGWLWKKCGSLGTFCSSLRTPVQLERRKGSKPAGDGCLWVRSTLRVLISSFKTGGISPNSQYRNKGNPELSQESSWSTQSCAGEETEAEGD